MTILYILDYFTPSKGGVERVFENIIQYQSKKHKIIVLTSRFSVKLKKFEKKENIEIYRIGKTRLSFTLLGFFFVLKFSKKIDLVHTSTYNAAFVAKFFKLFNPSIPVILTSHEILGKVWFRFKGKFKGFFYKKIEDLIYKLGFHYVFVSKHVQNVALSNYKIKSFTQIYNGLEKIEIKNNKLRQKLEYGENDLIGVFAGRPGWPKGLDFILNNFDKIKKVAPNFKLLLLLLEKNKQKKYNKLNINHPDIKVLYEIDHKQIYDYLNIADIGIIPSRSEGFGFTALEFSCLNKTTILSNIGAIAEINFGDCHFFTPDNWQSFKFALKEVLNGKKNNYGYNRKLSIEKMNQKYEKLYNKLLSKQ